MITTASSRRSSCPKPASADDRDERMRSALGILIRRLEDELADHVAEIDEIDRRTDELLAVIWEKQAQRRDLAERAWRLTARIERAERAAA